MHWTAFAAHPPTKAAPGDPRRIGNYYHMLPEQQQARRVIWQAVNPHTGIRRIHEVFPPELMDGAPLENEMLIRFKNGSTWQLLGSENYESLMGTSVAGIVYSEWALTTGPDAFVYLSPVLAENAGWALFVSTPRGENHAADMYRANQGKPDWFTEVLDAYDLGVFTHDQLGAERQALIDLKGELAGDSLFRQEYRCSFSAALAESYYGHEIEKAEHEGRIGLVPYNPNLPVHTAHDIGHNDAYAIWFLQIAGAEIHAIDYLEDSGQSLPYYVKKLKEKPYVYGSHVFGHDLAQEHLGGTEMTRIQTLRSLGIQPKICKSYPGVLEDGISAVMMMLPRMRFDAQKCKRGLECLRKYRRKFDPIRKVYQEKPIHDQYSNGADSLRYFAMGNIRNAVKRDLKRQRQGFF